MLCPKQPTKYYNDIAEQLRAVPIGQTVFVPLTERHKSTHHLMIKTLRALKARGFDGRKLALHFADNGITIEQIEDRPIPDYALWAKQIISGETIFVPLSATANKDIDNLQCSMLSTMKAKGFRVTTERQGDGITVKLFERSYYLKYMRDLKDGQTVVIPLSETPCKTIEGLRSTLHKGMCLQGYKAHCEIQGNEIHLSLKLPEKTESSQMTFDCGFCGGQMACKWKTQNYEVLIKKTLTCKCGTTYPLSALIKTSNDELAYEIRKRLPSYFSVQGTDTARRLLS